MPTKFTIDYETGKVQGFLIPKDQIIDPKPWPTDDIEGAEAFVNESEEPKVFTKTFTFKMTKKDTLAWKRMFRRQNKLPRKLKKALRHVGFFQLPMERVEIENGVAFKQTVGFGPKDGYPCTKWVNKACLKLKANAIYIIERQKTSFLLT